MLWRELKSNHTLADWQLAYPNAVVLFTFNPRLSNAQLQKVVSMQPLVNNAAITAKDFMVQVPFEFQVLGIEQRSPTEWDYIAYMDDGTADVSGNIIERVAKAKLNSVIKMVESTKPKVMPEDPKEKETFYKTIAAIDLTIENIHTRGMPVQVLCSRGDHSMVKMVFGSYMEVKEIPDSKDGKLVFIWEDDKN